MAAVNDLKITVTGKQAHGAYPWSSIDPIVISAQIVNNLQTIVSRNLNVTENPGVVTIGAITPGIIEAAMAFAESRLMPIPDSLSIKPEEASFTTEELVTSPPLKASTRLPMFPDDNCCFKESKIEPEAA